MFQDTEAPSPAQNALSLAETALGTFSLLWYPYHFTISVKSRIIMAEFCSACVESNLQRKKPPWLQRVMFPVFRIQSEQGRQTHRSLSSYFHKQGRVIWVINTSLLPFSLSLTSPHPIAGMIVVLHYFVLSITKQSDFHPIWPEQKI